jgi:folate-binding protein YgfZ
MATLRTWRAGDEVRLLLSRPLASSIAKRLSMFVLRAKAKVIDTSDASVVFGLIGEPAVRAAIASTTISPPAPEASVVDAGLELVGLPAMPHDETGALPRWLLIVPADQAASTWTRLSATASPISARAWRRSEVLAGVPRIVPGTSEHFVPQMVNFESVDGVSFTKGCYPGQEIVARSQYLGKLKRRMFLGSGHGDLPVPGQDVHTLIDGAEPCGEVVLAAPDGQGGFEVLFESQIDAVEQGGVRIGLHRLTLRPLPYPLRPVG